MIASMAFLQWHEDGSQSVLLRKQKKKKIDNPHKEKDKISTLSLWKIENIANKPTDPKARKIL